MTVPRSTLTEGGGGDSMLTAMFSRHKVKMDEQVCVCARRGEEDEMGGWAGREAGQGGRVGRERTRQTQSYSTLAASSLV